MVLTKHDGGDSLLALVMLIGRVVLSSVILGWTSVAARLRVVNRLNVVRNSIFLWP